MYIYIVQSLISKYRGVTKTEQSHAEAMPGLSRLQALTRLQQRLSGSCQTDGSNRRSGGKDGDWKRDYYGFMGSIWGYRGIQKDIEGYIVLTTKYGTIHDYTIEGSVLGIIIMGIIIGIIMGLWDHTV